MGKAVSASLYTRDYYLSDCTGYEEFLRSHGSELDPRLRRIIPYLTLQKGQTLLDVGCGRGEVVFYAALQGVKAEGIDYSAAAIDLANEARRQQGKQIQALAKFTLMDAKHLTYSNSSLDWVIMTDVVEHLYPDELDQVYREVYRVLKPGGSLIIHTEPNRLYNDITYPYYCYPLANLLVKLNQLLTGKTYPGLPHPAQLRTASHKYMHINEATYYSLKHQLIKAGFKLKIDTSVTILKPVISWKDSIFNALVCWHPLSTHWPANIGFANDFIVTARK